MSGALISIVSGLGDVMGTNLYDHFGSFTVCVIAITVVYTLIPPVLLLRIRRLIDTADGQTPRFPYSVLDLSTVLCVGSCAWIPDVVLSTVAGMQDVSI